VKGGKYMSEIKEKVTLDELKEELKKNSIDDLKSFKNLFSQFYKQLQQDQKDFIKYLEWAYEKSGRDNDIKNILEDITGKNASELIDSLKRLGYAIQKDLGEEFEKAGYRLLEQTRAGKRSDVMYGITRIFFAKKRNLPDALNEAFKPYYSDELFKCFMFTFLSSAIKPKEQKEE